MARLLRPLGLLALASAADLKLALDEKTGGFEIHFEGGLWLKGGEYRLGKYASSDKGLTLLGSERAKGKDQLGDFSATVLKWAKSSSKDVLMETHFLQYAADPSVLVFEQHFPKMLNLTELNEGAAEKTLAGTIFPGFLTTDGTPDLPCFSYHHTFPTMQKCNLHSYKASLLGGVPLIAYKPTNGKLPMMVFSPLEQPMAHQMAEGKGFFGAGVKATVHEIPAGWTQRFLLLAGEGINAGLFQWGERMLKWAGKERVDNRYRDDVHGKIGFWTDNGGYYHYDIGNNKSLGSNYEEVLPKVKAYHDELGVPFGHWQFDSWFYPKDGGVNPGGGGGAVTNWTADKSVFPSGMAAIQDKLKLPIVMHNRHWSVHSDYIKHWTDIEWYVSKKAAVPKDPAKFFQRFFTQQEGWGLAMYEQDWMDLEYYLVEALHTNISLGDLWLRGMASGAQGSGRTMQYCMPLPSELLAAAGLPAVTNARATGDYFHSGDQWAVGATALLYFPLNILPFKDGFYSSKHPQVGGQTVGPEEHPDREAIMATLSTAMVGPMDGIYLLNKSRVMATCRTDGLVLKPDKPITTTDACFLREDPTCKVFETYSDLKGLGRVHYYFQNEGNKPMLAEEVYEDPDECRAVYNWYTREVSRLAPRTSLSPGYEGHIYALVVPVKENWIFIGEPRVYASASNIRFKELQVGKDALLVRWTAASGETVEVCVAREPSFKVRCKSATEKDGKAEVEFQAKEWGDESSSPSYTELMI